jgi:hypothetical protein
MDTNDREAVAWRWVHATAVRSKSAGSDLRLNRVQLRGEGGRTAHRKCFVASASSPSWALGWDKRARMLTSTEVMLIDGCQSPCAQEPLGRAGAGICFETRTLGGSFRIPRQMAPLRLSMLGWYTGWRKRTRGGSNGYRSGRRSSRRNTPPEYGVPSGPSSSAIHASSVGQHVTPSIVCLDKAAASRAIRLALT